MRCDIIARGVIAATEALSLSPSRGAVTTNVDEGKQYLQSRRHFIPYDDLAEGAQKCRAYRRRCLIWQYGLKKMPKFWFRNYWKTGYVPR